MSLAIAVFSLRHSGQLLPPNEYSLAEESLLHLISGFPLLPHILGEGGGLSLVLVAQVTLVAVEPLLECPKGLTIVMLPLSGCCHLCLIDHGLVKTVSLIIIEGRSFAWMR